MHPSSARTRYSCQHHYKLQLPEGERQTYSRPREHLKGSDLALLERMAAEYQAAHGPALTALGITANQVNTFIRRGCAYAQSTHSHSPSVGEQGNIRTLIVSPASRQDMKDAVNPRVLTLIYLGCTLVQAEEAMEPGAWGAWSRGEASRQAACACTWSTL